MRSVGLTLPAVERGFGLFGLLLGLHRRLRLLDLLLLRLFSGGFLGFGFGGLRRFVLLVALVEVLIDGRFVGGGMGLLRGFCGAFGGRCGLL